MTGNLAGSGTLLTDTSGSAPGGTPGGPAGGNGQGAGGTPDAQNQTPPTYESWLAGQDETVKGLIDGHVQGLRTALADRAQQRDTLSRQVKDLQAKAEKGSELERQLAELQGTLAAAERRATFVEEAVRPDIGCINVKAAYALATAEELFDRQGRPDWNALKTAAPELFRRPGAGSADGGAGGQQAARLDMNAIIRRAAGRG